MQNRSDGTTACNGNCPNCPAQLVDPAFRCMNENGYAYNRQPQAFRKRVNELDEIRKYRMMIK